MNKQTQCLACGGTGRSRVYHDLSVQNMEVEWYRKNGLYPKERIRKDASGALYVVGDWSWNRNRQNPPEDVEQKMNEWMAGEASGEGRHG